MVNKKHSFLSRILFICLVLFALLNFSSCKRTYKKPVIIWTDKAEFASYAELFNTSQEICKVQIVYKKNLAHLLPLPKGEIGPDLLIGSWLKNSQTKKFTSSLDYMFSDLKLNRTVFYSQLLESGQINDTQYLIPVSFNIPTILFSKDNIDLINENYLLSLDQIRNIAAAYNEKKDLRSYNRMGYGLNWNQDFLYEIAKLKGVNFKESGSSFSWDESALEKALSYMKEWTVSANESTNNEKDFAFKYLYTPFYQQVSQKRSLFAYTHSNLFFDLPPEKIETLEFRWLQGNQKIPVIDDIVYLGMYRNSKNGDAASLFINWFFKESTQKQILERQVKMNLKTSTFGIANGFSALKNVTERVFPIFYPILLKNLPSPESLSTPHMYPPRWDAIRETVIKPYLLEASETPSPEKKPMSLDNRLKDWSKQNF